MPECTVPLSRWRVALVVLLLSPIAAAQQPLQAAVPGFAAQVDAVMEAQLREAGIPGAQIAVAQDGKLVYVRAYGIADIEGKRPVGDRALFHIGSVSKLFTGMLLASLASDGTVDLHAPISRYVPELEGKRVGEATTHQLLSHSAGWFDDAQPFGRTDPAAMGDVLRQLPDSLVFGPPDRVFSYSNPGFSMAGFVAERASGKAFAEVMRQRVLDRVSRDHATYHPLVAMTRDFSLGHAVTADGDLGVQRPMAANSAEYGAGFLFASAADVARLAIALMDGGMLDGQRAFDQDTVQRVTRGDIAIPGTPDNRSGYGLQVDRVGGERVWRKSGASPGFSADLSMWPDRRLAVAIVANRDSPMPVATTVRVGQLVGGIPVGAPASAPAETDGTAIERAAVVGRYRSGAATSVEIVDRDGQLQWIGARGSFPLRFIGQDRVSLKAPSPQGRVFFLVRDATGAVEFLHSRSRAWVRQRP